MKLNMRVPGFNPLFSWQSVRRVKGVTRHAGKLKCSSTSFASEFNSGVLGIPLRQDYSAVKTKLESLALRSPKSFGSQKQLSSNI
jgi:hypothetical protein